MKSESKLIGFNNKIYITTTNNEGEEIIIELTSADIYQYKTAINPSRDKYIQVELKLFVDKKNFTILKKLPEKVKAFMAAENL